MPTSDERNEVHAPPSAKLPNVEAGASALKPSANPNPNAPKMTEGGVTKDPASGSELSAAAKSPIRTNPSTNQPTTSPKNTTNATSPGKPPAAQVSAQGAAQAKSSATSPAAKAAEDAAPKDTRPLSGNITDLKGEILQGDSFRLSFKIDDVSFQIPISMETSRDLYTLDNTFKIVAEIAKAANRSVLDEKFKSFVSA